MLLLPLLAVLYVLGHFTLYVVALRHRGVFHTEKGILLFHIVSWFTGATLFGIAGAIQSEIKGAVLAVVGIGSVHGIYSLSFLELWSLTEGSYSLTILSAVNSAGRKVTSSVLAGLATVGTAKQADRSIVLHRLGLFSAEGDLTFVGRATAVPLRLLLWLSAGRPTN